MTLTELGQLLDNHAMAEDMAGTLMFVERPDRWYDDPHWRCVNDHVTTQAVSGWLHDPNAAPGHDPEYSYQLCSVCSTIVRLTFPEDVSGPLKPALELM